MSAVDVIIRAALILGLLLLIAAVGGLVLWTIDRNIKRRGQEMRAEKRRRDWTARSVATAFAWKTLSGFKLEFVVEALVQKVNDEEFHAHMMTEERNYANPVRQYHSRYVQVRLSPFGPWYPEYHWYADGSPGIGIYQYDTSGDTLRGRFDPNGCDLRDAARAESLKNPREAEGANFGCTVAIQRIKPRYDADMIEENYNMIDAEAHAEAEKFIQLQKFREASVIKALKFRLDLLQPTTEHSGQHVTIRTSVTGRAVTISWEIRGEAAEANDWLRGYRTTDSFYIGDPWDDTGKNGQLVVDARGNNSCIDHQEPGRTYFYTFFRRRPKAGGSFALYDLIRFQVHVPAEKDLTALKKLLEDSRATRTTEDPQRERRNRMLDRINFAVETREVLMAYQKRKAAEINADPRYSEKEKEDLIAALADEIREAPHRPH